MMKALYSGVSGLRSHQTKMDVIGNNIANVNTYAYKSQRTTFSDVYYQAVQNPSKAVAGTVGGTNSSTVGYGAQVSSIDTIHTLSGYSPTNKSTDLYINGEGYFIVQNASGEKFYTRNGAFNFDSQGNLVDSNGSLVMGIVGTDVPADLSTIKNELTTADGGAGTGASGIKVINIANFKNYTNVTINSDGSITASDMTDNNNIKTLAVITVATVPNQGALVSEGGSYYSAGNNTGIITAYAPGLSGSGGLVSGGLEMSNVDLANEFSDMIITQRGYQANSKIITVVDEMLEQLVNMKR
ncbi:flagellar hook-basal body protein [Sedimentibacter saalensis]|jgi:flagellar hook protein FlgE|uniref:Flagellar hook protein FlgE n=1 Tax=Sedimentibacter saalensis TaxID=130788 RepID=A0A562J6I0_9FIRM|nr:flagellar hook-basal body complex protein [Sedimentibacter saalensis]MEA5095184.1 flagellar hook-basal body complex protein [Sedimentibacter saalensis]TWH78737.1 flagellar hook protein FlgE [Sedimentibacter saalensis]